MRPPMDSVLLVDQTLSVGGGTTRQFSKKRQGTLLF